jgi:hypothetical protein
MPIFIPVVIGLAVAGTVGAAGAIGTVVKKRIEKKKRKDEIARQQKSAEQREADRQRKSAEQREAARQRQAAEKAAAQQAAAEREEEAAQQRQAAEKAEAQQAEAEREARLRRLRPYDKQSLVKALDQSIAKAASDTLDAALAKPPFDQMTSHERTDIVRRKANAMQSSLGSLRMPDYNDDITAAAYLLEYHPQHVGLAHAIVNQAVTSRDSGKLIAGDSGSLHIVDLAAGTLAMQFGAAIAVAEALNRGETVGKVVVDSVDISPTMLKVGRIAWDNFVLSVQSDKNLVALAESCRLIEPHRYVRQDDVPERDGECWVSCLHGVYDENSSDLNNSLHTLHDNHRPIVGLMTCWGKAHEEQNVEIAKRISPFQGENWQTNPVYFLPRRAEYPIPFLFDRQEPDTVETAKIGHKHEILKPEYRRFLWRPTDTAVLTYHRNFSHHDH